MQNHTHPPTQKSKPGGKKKKNEKKNTNTAPPPQPLTFLPSSFCSRSVRPRCRPAQYVILSYPSRSVPLATLFLSIPVPISLANFILSCRRRSFLLRPPARAVSPPSATDSSTSHLLPYHLLYPYHFLLSFTLPPLFFTLPFTFCHLLPYNLLLPLSVTFYITTFVTSSFTLPPLSLSIIFYLVTSFTTFHRLLPFLFFSTHFHFPFLPTLLLLLLLLSALTSTFSSFT